MVVTASAQGRNCGVDEGEGVAGEGRECGGDDGGDGDAAGGLACVQVAVQFTSSSLTHGDVVVICVQGLGPVFLHTPSTSKHSPGFRSWSGKGTWDPPKSSNFLVQLEQGLGLQ